jgi:hypothetical protein
MDTAVMGRGYERHLFGLKLIHLINYPDQDLPEFFQDKAFAANSYYKYVVCGRVFFIIYFYLFFFIFL